MASLTARCSPARGLLFALLLAAHGLLAQAQEVPTAQTLETLAREAFHLYEQEAAQPDEKKRDELLRQRTEAFYFLSGRLAQFISMTFPEETRETPSFVLVLFTYAHYLELSADIWHARDRYIQVCELIDQKLVPAGQPVPVYNKVSILRLCIRQIDRLSAAIRVAGRRPTKVSILFSLDEPNPTDFLNALRPHLRQGGVEVPQVVRATNQNSTFALLAAVERFGGKPEDAAAWVPQVLGELARAREVPFQVARLDRVAVVGLGLTAAVFAEQVAAIRTVTGAYQRIIAKDVLKRAWPVFVMRGPMAEADAAFLTSAFTGYEPLDPKYKYESRGALKALVGPQVPSHDSEEYAGVDQAVVWSGELPGAASRLAFLDYDGTGAYSMKYFAWLLDGLMERRTVVTPVPSYECARSRSAARVCLMHAGAFARFLDSVRSASSPERTVLQLYAARLDSASNLTPSGELALLEEVSGKAVEDLGKAFLAYVRSAPSLNSSGPSREARELARVLEQDYRAGLR